MSEISLDAKLNIARNLAAEHKNINKKIERIESGKTFKVSTLIIDGDFDENVATQISNVEGFNKEKVYDQIKWIIFAELKRCQEEVEKEYKELISNVSLKEELSNE
ncbi:hypothetical protein GLV94_05150 [Virgibacillus halodenitrificans]|uniref:hypothetical protein n=1 Tax=Virgibacillus halodenitrificans TaxID=1482 RepID=UPI001367C59A|nr:hypothetical protein [Virgibacillus halodenitrificans]MYL45021.1 hypothetical protein [Virgibacillus halodenitrificans]